MYSTNRTEWKEIRKTFFLTITYSDTAVREKIRLIRSRDINWLNYIMNFFTTGRSRKFSQPFYNKKFFSPFSFQLFFTLPCITYFTLLHHCACLHHLYHQQHRIASYYVYHGGTTLKRSSPTFSSVYRIFSSIHELGSARSPTPPTLHHHSSSNWNWNWNWDWNWDWEFGKLQVCFSVMCEDGKMV